MSKPKHSAETRKKMSEARKKYWQEKREKKEKSPPVEKDRNRMSDEHREAIAQANTKKQSPETIKRIKIGKMGSKSRIRNPARDFALEIGELYFIEKLTPRSLAIHFNTSPEMISKIIRKLKEIALHIEEE